MGSSDHFPTIGGISNDNPVVTVNKFQKTNWNLFYQLALTEPCVKDGEIT